jgi:small-conductance mechanosensitive channel
MIELLKYKIIHFDNFSLSVFHLLELLVVYILVRIVFVIFKKSIARSQRLDVGQKYSIFQIVKYLIYIFYGIFAAGMLGINLSLLLASSAALLVGIGFGLQHLFKDIVSGLVILFDRTIKVNDVIEMDNIVSKVLKINLRTTTVLTREDKYIVIPNSVILESKVINWTLSQITSRFEIPLNVAYNSDVSL